MDIGPIWRAMLRNKAGFILIALQIAVTLTILVNAFGIIQENRTWRKNVVRIRQLDDMARRLKSLEKRLDESEQ